MSGKDSLREGSGHRTGSQGSGHNTKLLTFKKSGQHSQTQGLSFECCCVEQGFRLHDPCGSLPLRIFYDLLIHPAWLAYLENW